MIREKWFEDEVVFRLAELKIEYAEKQGWCQEDFWWGDEEKAQEANRYAYEMIEIERD